MKRIIILVSLVFLNFAFAGVTHTTFACQDTNDLMKLKSANLEVKDLSVEKIYEYAINNNCEILNPSDEIKVLSKPSKSGFLKILVIKDNKVLYTFEDAVKYKFSSENHLLKKSF